MRPQLALHSPVSHLFLLLASIGALTLPLVSRADGIPGTTSHDSVSAPNSSGDLFAGGTWCNAAGGAAWAQREFEAPYLVDQITIAKAGTDVTTEGSQITLRLRTDGGNWLVVDQLEGTNINWPGVGRSVPGYTKRLSPAVLATAFRIELRGHGWFIASGVTLTGHRSSGPPPDRLGAGQPHWEYVGVEVGVQPYDPAGCYPDEKQGGEGGLQVTRRKTCGDTEPLSRYSVEWGAPAPTLFPGRPMGFAAKVTLAENRRPDWTLGVLLIGKFIGYDSGPGTSSNYSTPAIGPQGNPQPSGRQFAFDNLAQPMPFVVPGHGLADAQGRVKFIVEIGSSSIFHWDYIYRWVEPPTSP